MAKSGNTLTKAFRGVPNGEIYPKVFEPGEACPEELQRAAQEQGCFEAADKAPSKAADKAPSKASGGKKSQGGKGNGVSAASDAPQSTAQGSTAKGDGSSDGAPQSEGE